MDRDELINLLHHTPVPEAYYDIPGVHTPRMRPDAFYFLRRESDTWVVGVCDRAQDIVLSRFDTEDGACQFLYDTLLRSYSPPSPDAPQHMVQVLRDRDEIQRKAWEAFERARRGDDGPRPDKS